MTFVILFWNSKIEESKILNKLTNKQIRFFNIILSNIDDKNNISEILSWKRSINLQLSCG